MGGHCVLWIQLLALPHPLHGINVKYKMECFGGDHDNLYVQYENRQILHNSVCWPDGTLLLQQLQSLSSLKFVVTMQILKFNEH